MVDDNPQNCMAQFLATATIDQLERLNMHMQTRNIDALMLHTSKTIFANECAEISGKLKVYKPVDKIFTMVCKYIYMSCFMEEEKGRFQRVKYAALVTKSLMNASAAAGASSAATVAVGGANV